LSAVGSLSRLGAATAVRTRLGAGEIDYSLGKHDLVLVGRGQSNLVVLDCMAYYTRVELLLLLLLLHLVGLQLLTQESSYIDFYPCFFDSCDLSASEGAIALVAVLDLLYGVLDTRRVGHGDGLGQATCCDVACLLATAVAGGGLALLETEDRPPVQEALHQLLVHLIATTKSQNRNYEFNLPLSAAALGSI
jgi:hypothetical protein